MQADIENARCGQESNKRFTNVVFPDPDGAVITIIFPVAKRINYLRIKRKKLAFSNGRIPAAISYFYQINQ